MIAKMDSMDTSLAHLWAEEFPKGCYRELNHHAAAGIDRVSYATYGENLDGNIAERVKRLREKRYRANDIRRVWIPTPDGSPRPLGIPIAERHIWRERKRATDQALSTYSALRIT